MSRESSCHREARAAGSAPLVLRLMLNVRMDVVHAMPCRGVAIAFSSLILSCRWIYFRQRRLTGVHENMSKGRGVRYLFIYAIPQVNGGNGGNGEMVDHDRRLTEVRDCSEAD